MKRASYTRPSTPEEEAAAIERSKREFQKRKEKSKIVMGAKSGVNRENYEEVKKKINEYNLPLTLSFINISEIPITKTRRIINQIMVMYRNGAFETLPTNINGGNVAEYLGFKFSRVTHFCLLPMRGSPGHFTEFPANRRMPFDKEPNDIFK